MASWSLDIFSYNRNRYVLFFTKGVWGLIKYHVLICWFITCNFHLCNPLIIYSWIIYVFEQIKSFLSLSWNAFRLMKHLLVVASTSTSTFKFSIWAHIQQCPVPLKTALKDILWICFGNCPLGKLEKSGKLCFQFQYYYHVAPVHQRLRVPGEFFTFFILRSSTKLFNRVCSWSKLHSRYSPISSNQLAVAVEQPITLWWSVV